MKKFRDILAKYTSVAVDFGGSFKHTDKCSSFVEMEFLSEQLINMFSSQLFNNINPEDINTEELINAMETGTI